MILLVIFGGALVLLWVAVGHAAASTAAASATGNPLDSLIASEVPDQISITGAVPDNTMTGDQNIDDSITQITTDPATWPSGDRIWDICRAIATAEGYDSNQAAFRNNNPGDISDGASEFGSEYVDGSNVTTFPDAPTGWNWLYTKISNHITGKSATYSANLTIAQVGQKWAAPGQPGINWKNNVGRVLQVNPDTSTFTDYVNA
jgi:hypothetical protein